MARKCDHLSLAGLVAAGLFIASCRGCLADEVTVDEGSGGSPSASSSGPLASSGTGSTSTSDASSTGTDTSSAAESVSTGSGSTVSSSASSSSGGSECPINDSFTASPLSDCWTPIFEERLEKFGVDPGGDDYFANPLPNTGWWQEGAGGPEDVSWFLHQHIEGPFVVSVHVQLQANLGEYQMAGLLLRDGTLRDGDAESWLKWEIGRRGPEGGGGAGGAPDVDFGSIAAANLPGAGASWLAGPHAVNEHFIGRLGICRNGDTYRLLYRHDEAGTWEEAHVVSAPAEGGVGIPSFAGDVQVGLIANAYDDVNGQTLARFNDFAISRTTVADYFQCRAELINQTPGGL